MRFQVTLMGTQVGVCCYGRFRKTKIAIRIHGEVGCEIGIACSVCGEAYLFAINLAFVLTIRGRKDSELVRIIFKPVVDYRVSLNFT